MPPAGMQFSSSFIVRSNSKELMTSARIKVLNNKNQPVQCRVLLDTCSAANFITVNLANKLKLRKTKCCIPVGALNELITSTKHAVTVQSIPFFPIIKLLKEHFFVSITTPMRISW